jgi:acyl dehydratase
MQEGLRISHQFSINSDIYKGFKKTFKDENILHTNEEYAQEKGFREKVMHGNILNGFISFFVGELLPDKNILIQKQEISFHKPVYLNDNLIFEAILSEVYESVNSFVFKFKFKNESGLVAKGKVQIGKI